MEKTANFLHFLGDSLFLIKLFCIFINSLEISVQFCVFDTLTLNQVYFLLTIFYNFESKRGSERLEIYEKCFL